jgi:hypothetical protein
LQARRIAGQKQAFAGEKVRKPAATRSLPSRWYFMMSSAVATTMLTPSKVHSVSRSASLATNVPAMPNAPPMARPIAATVSEVERMWCLPKPGGGYNEVGGW